MNKIEPFALLVWGFVGAFIWLFWSAVIKIVIEVMR